MEKFKKKLGEKRYAPSDLVSIYDASICLIDLMQEYLQEVNEIDVHAHLEVYKFMKWLRGGQDV